MLRGKMANGKNAKKATTTNQTNYFAHMRKNQKAKKIAKKAQRQLKIDNIRKTTTKQQKQLCAKNLNFANVLGNETKQQKQREDGPQFGKKSQKDSKKPQKQQNTIHRMSQFANDERAKESRKLMFFVKRPPESKMSELANKRTLQLDFEIRNWQIKTKTKNSKII